MNPEQQYDSTKIIQKLFQQKSLLDVALEVEKFLDFCNLYVYSSWIDGELVEGPIVSRYWVKIKLKYPYEKMPDPMGARVLYNVGVIVDYVKGLIMEPVKVKKPSDFRPNSKKPKLIPTKVWYISLQIPRHFIDGVDYNDLEGLENEEVDTEALDQAVNQTDKEGDTIQDTEGVNPQPIEPNPNQPLDNEKNPNAV